MAETMDMMSYARRFFHIVKLGQTESILKYLRHIDVNYVDEDGDTALTIAAKDLNYVIQKLLLEQGAAVNKTDKERKSPLHHVAKHGEFNSINLLLANGANIDVKDENGRTPLQYAVVSGHIKAVDLLIFCGADGTVTDNINISAMDLCRGRHNHMEKLMVDSIETVHAIKQKYINIDRAVLKSGETKYYPNLGCTIKAPITLSPSDVYMLSRRVRPEFGRQTLSLMSKELVISDTLEFRISGGTIEDMVIIDIPLYSSPEAYEEIHMKTNVNPIASDETIERHVHASNISDEEDTVICSVQVDFRSVDTVMLVTRPKKEYLPMPKQGGKVRSTIDTTVTFDVEPGTFSKDGSLVHHIIPRPFTSKNEFPNLISCTHFHDVYHTSNEQPMKEVEITLPLPPQFSKSEKYKVYVLVREGDEDTFGADKWTIVTDSPKITKTTITAFLPHFCAYTSVECKRSSDIGVKTDTEIRFQRARRYECEAIFLGLPTKFNDEGVSELLAECTSDPNYKSRIETHVANEYIDQSPSYTNVFKAFSGQTFSLHVTGGLTTKDKSDISLQFHPKRKDNNKRTFLIKPLNEDAIADSSGQLKIAENKKEAIATPHFEQNIDLYLKHPEIKNESLKLHNYKGFLSDKLMGYISKELSQTVLQKLLVDLYMSVSDKESLPNLLLRWRQLSNKKKDCGLSALIAGLCRLEDGNAVVDHVLQQLKEWKKKNMTTKVAFTIWLSDIDPGNFSPKTNEVQKPMSDDFLRWIVNLIPEHSQEKLIGVCLELGLEKNQISNIRENKLYEGGKVHIYLLLKSFRDLYGDKFAESFEKLHQVLNNHNDKFPKVDEQCLNMARKWLDKVKSGSDLIDALKQYIEVVQSRSLDENQNKSQEEEQKISHDKEQQIFQKKLQGEPQTKSHKEQQNKSQEELQKKSQEEQQNESQEEDQKKSQEEDQKKSQEEDKNKSQEEDQNKSQEEDQNKSQEEQQKKSQEEDQTKSQEEQQNKSLEEQQKKSQDDGKSQDEEQTKSQKGQQNKPQEEQQNKSREEELNKSQEEELNKSQEEEYNKSQKGKQNKPQEEQQNKSQEEELNRSQEKDQNKSQEEQQNKSQEEELNRSQEKDKNKSQEG